MSIARGEFITSLSGISGAISLEFLAQGSTGTIVSPSILVLRRGILIAALIALETFVRDRTGEALRTLERWPRSYDQLPEKLRLSARLNALSHLQHYAKMLKRQGDDFEGLLHVELGKMSSGDTSVLQFTKFVAGDYTGNMSDTGLKELLSSLQIQDCWNTFRVFSADVGIGVPSVQEIVRNTVQKRHRSAHSAGYSPTASEITELHSNLLCIAICFDVAVTSSMEQSLSQTDNWISGRTAWRDDVNLYIIKPYQNRFRLFKYGRDRALNIEDNILSIRSKVPRPASGKTTVVVQHDLSGRPFTWDIL